MFVAWRGGLPEGMAVSLALGAWMCEVVDQSAARRPSRTRTAIAVLDDLVENHVVVAPRGTYENGAAPANGIPPRSQTRARRTISSRGSLTHGPVGSPDSPHSVTEANRVHLPVPGTIRAYEVNGRIHGPGT